MMYRVARIGGEPVLYEETDYVDDWGVKRTIHEFIKRMPSGIRVRIPVLPPIKVENYSRKMPIFSRDETRRLKQHEIHALFKQHRSVIESAA